MKVLLKQLTFLNKKATRKKRKKNLTLILFTVPRMKVCNTLRYNSWFNRFSTDDDSDDEFQAYQMEEESDDEGLKKEETSKSKIKKPA